MAKDPQTTIKRILSERLDTILSKADIEDLTPQDTAEVLKIKSALAADRPTSDLIMSTIFNQMAFLNQGYHPESAAEFQHITRFLQRFLEHTQQELLGKAGTYKEGLNMTLEG